VTLIFRCLGKAVGQNLLVPQCPARRRRISKPKVQRAVAVFWRTAALLGKGLTKHVTKNVALNGELRLPLFVITPTPSNGIHREFHLGWVVDIDNTAMQCLVEFDDQWRAPASASTTSEFRLDANREERAQIEQRLKRSQRFAFEVGKRCGWRCSVCAVNLKPLSDAAHIRGAADRGSDDPRSGQILCKNHHAALDAVTDKFPSQNRYCGCARRYHCRRTRDHSV
jgi:hypothetical protein